MAEGVVSFLLVNLNKLMNDETKLIVGVRDQIYSLNNELEWICSFLKQADARSRSNELVKIWVTQVRDVAYDAEDVIDTFLLNMEQQRQRKIWSKCANIINHLITLHNLGKKIEDIKTRTSEISANKGKYMIEEAEEISSSKSTGRGAECSSSDSWYLRRRYMMFEEAEVVGFEDEEKKLVSQLIAGEKCRAVISIVGMGGSGKTTLAEKVYNSNEVKEHFNCRAWVYVTKKHKSKKVLRRIIKRVMMLSNEEIERIDRMKVEELAMKLHGYLKERTYLVVLDDVWSIEVWDDLKFAFPNEMNGSRLLLTTRNEDVASHADARNLQHRLRFLSEEESWVLFCKKVFPEDIGSSFPPYLEKLGREIVAKCDGLPLALVVLGGFLFRKTKCPGEWADFLMNISQRLSEGNNKISTVFELSYMDLPCDMKSSFLYCSLFPEDLEIPAKKLIQLWVAEGFLPQRWKPAEEQAEENLEELVSRSMLQVIQRSSDGRVKTCRVHHIVREISILETKESKFLDIHGNEDYSASPTKARRLAIHSHDGQYISQNHHTPCLRSLLCFTTNKEEMKLSCRGFKLLRVMDLEGILVSELPNEIGNLFHLRYLGLRDTFVHKIPSTIRNLCNMEILDLRSILVFVLHDVIRKMQRLRHLYVDQAGKVKHLRIGRFRDLRTLSMIEAGNWIQDGLSSSTNLRKLGVSGDLILHGKALNDCIEKFYKLRSLKLKTKTVLLLKPFSHHLHLHKLSLNGQIDMLLNHYDFPPSLSKLTLNATELREDPMETLEKLPNLTVLKLLKKSYMGKKMVCSAGMFHKLEVLEVRDLPELEEWMVHDGGMLSLGFLFIDGCLKLKMLPEGLQSIVTLRGLELQNMPEEFKERLKENEGEDWHKIQHIPLLTI